MDTREVKIKKMLYNAVKCDSVVLFKKLMRRKDCPTFPMLYSQFLSTAIRCRSVNMLKYLKSSKNICCKEILNFSDFYNLINNLEVETASACYDLFLHSHSFLRIINSLEKRLESENTIENKKKIQALLRMIKPYVKKLQRKEKHERRKKNKRKKS
jgi:hypothetical protein